MSTYSDGTTVQAGDVVSGQDQDGNTFAGVVTQPDDGSGNATVAYYQSVTVDPSTVSPVPQAGSGSGGSGDSGDSGDSGNGSGNGSGDSGNTGSGSGGSGDSGNDSARSQPVSHKKP